MAAFTLDELLLLAVALATLAGDGGLTEEVALPAAAGAEVAGGAGAPGDPEQGDGTGDGAAVPDAVGAGAAGQGAAGSGAAACGGAGEPAVGAGDDPRATVPVAAAAALDPDEAPTPAATAAADADPSPRVEVVSGLDAPGREPEAGVPAGADPAAAALVAPGGDGPADPAPWPDTSLPPARAQMVRPHVTVTGTVLRVRRDPEGEVYIHLRPDRPWARLVADQNRERTGGALVVSVPPTGTTWIPPEGIRVQVTGPYTVHRVHGWTQIAPAVRIAPA